MLNRKLTISEVIFDLYALKEAPGEANNPEVIKLYAEIGHQWVKKDSVAWCAAAANAVLKRGGFPHTGKLSAKSFIGLGKRIPVPTPPGTSDLFIDIVLFWRGKPWTDEDPNHFEPGHVGFPLKERKGIIWTVGGNQNDEFKVSGYSEKRREQYRRIYKLDMTG